MTAPTSAPVPEKEVVSSLAFQFCKIATFTLIAGKYALLAAAILSASFFVASYVRGRRTSRCVLRYPLLIAGLWSLVAAGAALALWAPHLLPTVFHWR